MKVFLKILTVLAWLGVFAGAILLAGFAYISHGDKYCRGINVNIINRDDSLLNAKNISSQLTARFGKLTSKNLRDIEIDKITRYFKNNPYIEDANVNLGLDGILNVNIVQRIPVMRAYNNNSEEFYVDSKGDMLPVSYNYSAHVVVVNGEIPMPFKANRNIHNPADSLKKTSFPLVNALHIAGILAQDTVAKALIEQIYIDKSGSIKLLSKIGKHVIILGDTTNTKEKINNLFSFYRKGLTKTGWDQYRILDLRFKNQVVCIK